MEEEVLPETAITAAPAEGTRVRRRLVQAMLFPQSGRIAAAASIAVNDDDKEENSIYDEVNGECKDEDEDEWCGGQSGKKKRGLKQKTGNSKPRALRKKVKANGDDASNLKTGGDSTEVPKSIFFSKASVRQHQKRKVKEKVCIVSDGEDDINASPSTPDAASRQSKRGANSTPQKRRSNITPKKKAIGSGGKGACYGKSSPNLPIDESPSKPLPNLRLEAKFMAEETSRIYAGKQVHPFFSSWKVDKRNQDLIDLESERHSFDKEGKGVSFNPIHVYERHEDEAITLDWKNWTFSDMSATNSSSDIERGCSSIKGGSHKPLQFHNYLGSIQPNSAFIYQNQIARDQCLDLSEEDPGIISIGCFSDDPSRPSYMSRGDAEYQSINGQNSCQHHPENCLWTDKYRPERALQVCGNGEAVKCLSEWLHLWHDGCSQSSKNDKPDGDSNYYNSDIDSEDIDEETALKNVLLVTGPVGSGKSAAIYACAKEQGFQVIEVNTSDWRNGTLVKQRFGEAMESHWVQGSAVNPATSEIKCQSKSSPIGTAIDSESTIVEVIPLLEGEDSEHASDGLVKPFWDVNFTANSQKHLKNLILFEDVDATLYEDYGFVSTIQQLAKTAKRPMILTSNSENPLLPSNLDRLHLCFTKPSLEELVRLARVVCAAEKARIHPSLVEHFVTLSQRDIRKTIINLQFWCQGQNCKRGTELQSIHSPLLYDLDATHWVLPKLIPFSCPSRLSELVEEEITKSLKAVMEEDNNLQDIINGVNLNDFVLTGSTLPDDKPEYINSRKEELLSLHWSLEDDIELAAPSEMNLDLNCLPHSPAADTQTPSQRRFSSVIFSDSEEEYFTERKPAALRRMLDDSEDEGFEVQGTTPSPSLLCERSRNLSTEPLNAFEGKKVEECICHCPGTVDCSHMNGADQPIGMLSEKCAHINATCKSFDVSCVPESSIVPETLFDDQTTLSSKPECNDHASSEEASNTLRKQILTSLGSVEGKKCFKCSSTTYGNQDTFETSYHISSRTVNQEVVGDSQVDHREDVSRGYQILDECSRVDFNVRSEISQMILDPPQHQIGFVQETWRKLRKQKMELRQQVAPQEIDGFQALKITDELSNLISDADLLLNECQPHLCDSVDPLRTPCDDALRSYNWHDHQLEMLSVFSEHGVCFFAKEIAALGQKVGSYNSLDLAQEMLVSSMNAVALGKLVTQGCTVIDSPEIKRPGSCFRLNGKTHSRLCNVLQSVVPSRSYLSPQGHAWYEYLSSLSRISRLEATRLSQNIDKGKRRRRRVARHYLLDGSFALTSDDISLMGQYNNYQQVSSLSSDASLR